MNRCNTEEGQASQLTQPVVESAQDELQRGHPVLFATLVLVPLSCHKQNLYPVHWKSCLKTCAGPACVLATLAFINSSVEKKGLKAVLSFGEMLRYNTSQRKWKAGPFSPFCPLDAGWFCCVCRAGRSLCI